MRMNDTAKTLFRPGSDPDPTPIRMIGAAIEPAIVINDGGADGTFSLGMNICGESTGPGDVAMAGWIEMVAGLAENPASVLRQVNKPGVKARHLWLARYRRRRDRPGRWSRH